MDPGSFAALMAVTWIVVMLEQVISGLMRRMQQVEYEQEQLEHLRALLSDRCVKLVATDSIKSADELELWLHFRTPQERDLIKDLTDFLFKQFEYADAINAAPTVGVA